MKHRNRFTQFFETGVFLGIALGALALLVIGIATQCGG